MPIRPDLRHFYQTPEYKAARARVVERAGNKCEQCAKPNGETVETCTGHTLKILGRSAPVMFWRVAGGRWTDSEGAQGSISPRFSVTIRAGLSRSIRVVCTMAHLDHDPANNADENLKLLCQWCHLNYDQLHHKETRSIRKDRQRPILTPDTREPAIEDGAAHRANKKRI